MRCATKVCLRSRNPLRKPSIIARTNLLSLAVPFQIKTIDSFKISLVGRLLLVQILVISHFLFLFLEVVPQIFLFGGNSRPPPAFYSPDHPQLNRTLQQPLVTRGHDHISVLMPDGRIFIAGGIGHDDEILSSTEILDPYMSKKEPGPPLRSARCSAAGALLNQFIYICGGNEHRGKNL